MALYSWKARHAWETTRTRGTNSTGGPRGTVITTVTLERKAIFSLLLNETRITMPMCTMLVAPPIGTYVLAGDSRHSSRSWGSRGTTEARITWLTTHTLKSLWTWGTWGTCKQKNS